MPRPLPFLKAHSCVLFVLKRGSARAAFTRLAAGLGICMALVSSSSTSHAQTLSGINGTISDQSGSAIPGAQVTITNIDTGVRRISESGSVGSYYHH